MAEWLHFPVRWVDLAKADTGGIEGYASVFNVVDQQDDVVVRGAFRKTLADWKTSGRRIPLVADHRHSSEGLIGSIASAKEDPYGLRFKAEFSASKAAQDVRLKAKEKHLDGVSIFGDIIQKSVEYVDGRPIRVLSEVKLVEISLTPFPANDKALVSAVKTATGGLELPDGDLDEAWIADMRAALAITASQIRKAAVDALVAVRYQTQTPAGETTETPPADGEKDDHAENAAKYALGIIGESGPDDSPPGGKPSDSLADLLAPLQAAGTTTELEALEAELKQMGHMA